MRSRFRGSWLHFVASASCGMLLLAGLTGGTCVKGEGSRRECYREVDDYPCPGRESCVSVYEGGYKCECQKGVNGAECSSLLDCPAAISCVDCLCDTGSDGGGGAGGSGANGGDGGAAVGGSGGAGGTGSGAGGGGGVFIAPHTVLDGSPVTTVDGCLLNAGVGVDPALIVIDEVITGAFELIGEGEMRPIQGGVALEPASLFQVYTGCVLNGNQLTDCPLFRTDYNIAAPTAGVAIFNAAFAELVSQPWVPQGPIQEFRVVVDADTIAQTGSIFFIDPSNINVNATATAPALGAAGGNRIGLLVNQIKLTRLELNQ